MNFMDWISAQMLASNHPDCEKWSEEEFHDHALKIWEDIKRRRENNLGAAQQVLELEV